MKKKHVTESNEFPCPQCRQNVPLGSKKCKWCGAYIPNPPTEPIPETPKKKSWFK